MASLNHMINLHKNKAGEKRLKKQNKETIHEDEDDIEEKERLVENRSPFYPQEERWGRVLCVKKTRKKTQGQGVEGPSSSCNSHLTFCLNQNQRNDHSTIAY